MSIFLRFQDRGDSLELLLKYSVLTCFEDGVDHDIRLGCITYDEETKLYTAECFDKSFTKEKLFNAKYHLMLLVYGVVREIKSTAEFIGVQSTHEIYEFCQEHKKEG